MAVQRELGTVTVEVQVVPKAVNKATKLFRRRLGLVPRAAIVRLAREIAERFHPERIILFGSYAYGKPTPDSDVDLLVVMPASNEISKASRICQAIEAPFPLDLIVRTPQRLQRRLELGDWFLREIVGQGKVLYDEARRRVGEKGRARLQSFDVVGQSTARLP